MTDRPIGRRDAPFSLRLTFEERARLNRQAGGLPLGGYIKSVLFSEDAAHYRAKRKTPVQDEKLLAEVLACLGASRISNNLNQLAKAVNQGTLYVDEDVKSDIVTACNDVRAMRLLLMQALGMQVENHHRRPESTSQSFARVAAQPKRFAP
ncbi:hypothetical protein DI396_16235 [Litorivita pollutaquae]|uniref:Bacterial mobilisation domain-containing protein n=1 Tax=Litorivita pollutaquae TaxID=2200892 RepID=A0A2V4N8D2_9RHOB|nr:plasmid mobilization relaxosome protein MobC [Litorivita pollutaquae]PYC46283.1 hypothetical protein DI396_16235 [Litorivita pollutaquae]